MRGDKKNFFLVLSAFAIVIALAYATREIIPRHPAQIAHGIATAAEQNIFPRLSNTGAAPMTAAASFLYTFNAAGILYESGTMAESSSPYWWLNSGGELLISNGVGRTMQGDAPILNRWRLAYALNNPRDTDGGTHPQNLFRLVSKSKWDNVEASVQFYISDDNLSSSSNRNQSNGLLLMSRYTGNGQTLYYAGIRVDGTAVIKKKINGIYYTLAQKTIFSGKYAINAATSAQSENLLPHKEWVGLKSSTVTNSDGSVTVTLSMQRAGGAWKAILQSTDAGSSNVGTTAPIRGAHYVGIRTDFMDVQFSRFNIRSL